jgi:hypothetical protein
VPIEDPPLVQPLKEAPNEPDTITFNAFDAYQVVGCLQGTSRLAGAIEADRALARRWLNVNIEGWVSAALEVGVCDNLSLQALTLVAGGPLCLEQAVAELMRQRQTARIFDKPTIHLPSWAAPYWDTSTAVNNAVDIAFGVGYGIIGASVIDDETGWAYITGPVEYALGVEHSSMGADLAERRQNFSEVVEERMALVRFDPAGSFRISFCVPECTCA